MAAKRAIQSGEEKFNAALNKARSALEARGAVTQAQLGPALFRDQIADRLVGEGYERTTKGVRLKAHVQLDKLLDQGAYVAISELSKRLSGVTKDEAQTLLKALTQSGRAAIVLRGSQLTLVPKSVEVVDRSDLSDLAAELKRLLGWVQKAQKDRSGATLLSQDLRENLSELTTIAKRAQPTGQAAKGLGLDPKTPSETHPDELAATALRGAILALRDEDSGLASVPALSRRLTTEATPEQIKRLLLAAHARGEFELRPEGGIGRLSSEDAFLCPLGAGGIPLSYVRLLEN